MKVSCKAKFKFKAAVPAFLGKVEIRLNLINSKNHSGIKCKKKHFTDMNSVVFGESMPPTRRMPSSVVTLVWKNFIIIILVQINLSFKLANWYFPGLLVDHTHWC